MNEVEPWSFSYKGINGIQISWDDDLKNICFDIQYEGDPFYFEIHKSLIPSLINILSETIKPIEEKGRIMIGGPL